MSNSSEKVVQSLAQWFAQNEQSTFAFPDLDFKVFPLNGARASLVYEVVVGLEHFFVKKFPLMGTKNEEFKSWLLSQLLVSVFPQLLATNYTADGHIVEIFEFLSGDHHYGPISPHEEEGIFLTISELRAIVTKHDSKNWPLETLLDLVTSFHKKLEPHTPIFQLGSYLISQTKYWDNQCEVLHYDLHRGNILFTAEKVRLLDAESLLLGPPEAQIACLLMSAFFLYEPLTVIRLSELLELWHEDVKFEFLGFHMLVRAWIGAAFFQLQKELGKNTVEEDELLSQYQEKIQEIQSFFNIEPEL